MDTPATDEFAKLKALSPRFTKETDDVLGTWLDLAQPIVTGYNFPPEQVEYATLLYAAHIGTQLLNTRSSGVTTETMGPLSRSFSTDSVTDKDDPFLDLFNRLLTQLGLGNNEVLFY
ncbi:DUF4054 domain-containing protein [Lentilactobacillus buchneri]|uniref:DUF4054 domain-containing protein n=1 Tax=Lentilactobacillus buchneri TaxID=1581 RepID=UPI0021A33FD9|nr:DUF4054 domain-containing protein [Lentilactobacillus buchneri]MCT2881927.1 DUF4054 domain-containing protein [Lentilactobacillus buchneri]